MIVHPDTVPTGKDHGVLDRMRGALSEAVRRQVLNGAATQRFDATMLRAWAEHELAGRKLIVVSNREPYSHERVGDQVRLVRNSGGLAVALDAVLRATGGVWVAHGSGDADLERSDRLGRVGVPEDSPAYTLARQWLTPEEQHGYYSGFSNGTLWPLCHVTYTRPRFDPDFWRAYQGVNRRFAETVLREAGSGPAVILLQDYHLALCARYIKEERPDLPVAMFWHIPWPNPEIFRILPWKAELLDGMLANDLIGFHLRYHGMNFLEAVGTEVEAKVDQAHQAVERGGHRTLVRAYPISTDVDGIAVQAESPACLRAMAGWRQRLGLGDCRVGLGIDRLDYTKGIPERLDALERLFERHPEWLGRLKFVQVGVPSRVGLPEYQDLTERLDAQVACINRRFGGVEEPVIHFLKGDFTFEDVVAFYRMADFVAVTSLHDGMNLVAKEYVAARTDLSGALVLSPFTGAARELERAWLVNPYDIEALAQTYHEVLSADPAELRTRMAVLRETLQRHTIYHWARELLDSVRRLDVTTHAAR